MLLSIVFFVVCLITSAELKRQQEYVNSKNEPQSRERRGIRELLDSKVIQAELAARSSRKGKGFDHYGVVVTVKGAKRWLIHKGHNFSRAGDTVITSATHMSDKWEIIKKKKVKNATVRDFMQAGGRFFHPVHDNAYHAAKRMMSLG